MRIREINSHSEEEISLVASRMKDTLVDVLGRESGESMYTVEWLVERVHWHLSPEQEAKILLAENDLGEIVAQAIVRVETDTNNNSYGYFSTVYVTPNYRSQGIAKKLIQEVIDWCNYKQLPYVTYNTAENNVRLIELYKKFGFNGVLKESGMVQLKKLLI